MSQATALQLVAVAMAMALVVRGLRNRRLSATTSIRWAAMWLVIIVALSLAFSRLT